MFIYLNILLKLFSYKMLTNAAAKHFYDKQGKKIKLTFYEQ